MSKTATRIGAVALIHRFDSSLNQHVHFHACVVDGVASDNWTPSKLPLVGVCFRCRSKFGSEAVIVFVGPTCCGSAKGACFSFSKSAITNRGKQSIQLVTTLESNLDRFFVACGVVVFFVEVLRNTLVTCLRARV